MAKGKGGFLGQDGLNAPDQATGVSATAGNESATVSWTDPSDTGASAITGYSVQSSNGDGQIPASLASASYDNLSFSVAGQVSPAGDGVHFKSDGTKMYVMSAGDNTVYQYSLSTAWDVSTASYDSVSLSVSSQDTGNWRDLDFSHDGTTLYCLGGNEVAYQYNLSSAWDLSTASYASKSFNFSSYNLPQGIFVNSDSTKVIICSSNTSAVWEFTLSTAKDISTASYTGNTKDLTGEDSGTAGVSMNSDGTVMVILGTTNDTVYLYNLSTAYDVSTASYSGTSLSVASQSTGADQIFLSQDSVKLYMIGDEVVYQYTTNLGGYPTSSPVTITGLTNGTSYTFNVWAINASGWSAPSGASEAVSPFSPIAVFNMYTVAEYVNIATTGNTSSWGTAQETNYRSGAVSSSTRGIIAGGGGSGTHIEYVAMPTGGSFSDFGDLLFNANYYPAGSGNSTRGLFAYGTSSARNDIQYITIASTGNATDFGNTPATRSYAASMGANSTRALWAGGYNSSFSVQSTIYYATIATTGNASTFGTLTQSRASLTGASNATRGFCAGGVTSTFVNTIDYVTIASTGSATDFGDLTATTNGGCATAGSTRGLIGSVGGTGGSGSDTINYITLASTGNALDFGDLWQSFTQGVAFSNDHGGLS